MNKLLNLLLFILLSLVFTDTWSQAFLEMPDITEVPEYEEESMLLDLDVPSVRERDPDPEAGPRLNVKQFSLQGLVEYPKLGITREALIKRVEAIRFDMMKEGDLRDSGYTLDELGEISDLMAEIEKQTEGEHVGPLEVQKLVFLIREQRRKRGVTLGMIETVADTITRFYREKGFILAKAYIPQQKVRDGIVTLTLLLGELGEVNIENRKRVKPSLINRVFKDEMNEPVTSWRIEEKLYLVNDIPGLRAQGFFSPGGQVGDTKLNVNIQQEKWISSNIRIDNHGSQTTGENRVYADVLVHNPLGIGDELHLSLLNSVDPDNTTYGALRYNSMVFSPRVRASVGVSNNDFASGQIPVFDDVIDVGDGSTNTISIAGESVVADASLSYYFKRSRVKNYWANITYTDISTQLDTLVGESDTAVGESSDVSNVSVGFEFDVLAQETRRLSVGSVRLNYTDNAPVVDDGGNTASLTEGRVENAVFINYDYSLLTFWEMPLLKSLTRVLYRSSGQIANRSMTNVNQFNLTGPTRGRGFTANDRLFDDALYFGVDWILGFPEFGDAKFFGRNFNQVFQPFVFADLGYGILHPVVADEGKLTSQLGNVGVGLKVNYGRYSANFVAASVVLDETNDGTDNSFETTSKSFYFDMVYSF